MHAPVALTIAGSDSSGSAGLQADLPTFAALGVHATSVVTVVTAQNARGIDAFHAVPQAVIAAQLDALMSDLPPVATKTGLLRDPRTLRLVIERGGELGRLVVDPVCTGSDGTPIVPASTVRLYRELAAFATVLTPNLWEVELLLGVERRLTPADVMAAVDDLRSLGVPHLVVTGGRGLDDIVHDLHIAPDGVRAFQSRRVAKGQTIRGTGCTFSAALTAGLANGLEPVDAIDTAHTFVHARLDQLDSPSAIDETRRPGVPHTIG